MLLLRMDYVDFEVTGGGLIMSRADLPNQDPDVDVILGQQVASLWRSSNF